MNNMSDTPLYDHVRLDLGIDPQVLATIAKYPSRLFATADGRLAPPRTTRVTRKPPKRK